MKTRVWTIAISLTVALTGWISSANAATIPVISTADSGAGTLRAALASAADGDTIDATGVSGTIILTTGELVVSNSVTIVGPGPATLAVDGNYPNTINRVFNITNAVTVAISSLTVTNGAILAKGGAGIYNDHSTLTLSNCTLSGNSTGDGGGIYNDGGVSGSAALTVVNSTVSGNMAFNGGGIFNDGLGGSATLTVIASTISDNLARKHGGGIFNEGLGGSATLTVVASTLSGNSADVFGGGIYNDGSFFGSATLTVSASTLSGNSAHLGGGIFNDGSGGSATVKISASTLSGNTAGLGGGIYNDAFVSGSSATLDIGNTILKAGSPGANVSNVVGTVTSRGFNLSSDDADGGAGTGPGGLLNVPGDIRNTDPLLGPLADNGGPTFTHALLPFSPAIDQGKRNAIPALALNTDQRGFPRPVDDPTIANATGGDGSDIGAFEAHVAPVAKCKNVTVTAGAAGTASASIDDGSFSPEGDTITLSQSPAGPYSVGMTSVTLTVTDSDGAASSCTATVTVLPSADLAISKAVVSGQAKPGQVLIYTIIVTNSGPNAATGVVVNDAVPQGTTFASASPAPSSAPPVGAGGTVVWSPGSMSSGATATFTLKVKVSLKGNALIVNTATVTSSSSDPNPANNSATVTSKRNVK